MPLQEGFISILFESRLTLYTRVVDARLHTFEKGHRTCVEMYFKKINAVEGGSMGVASDRDETQNILPNEEFLLYDSEYSRLQLPSARDDGYLNVMSFYLRASLYEQRDFYEPYTVMMYLETA